ncbi:hypothetical protein EGT07_21780 [Herbaspirillum sp. HC18]|nr:hypothetical protein EGT07_21780 [Herbaspirillum sp. HC18]
MSAIFPDAPNFSSKETDSTLVCEWVMPVVIPRRGYARKCVALPPGMPDFLEVSVIHSDEGTERSTAVIYGSRAYLIHYEFTPKRS